MTHILSRRAGARTLMAIALTLLPLTLAAQAQDNPDKPAEAQPSDCALISSAKQREDCSRAHAETKTIYLQNVNNQNDANEIMVAIRNSFDPGMKIYLDYSQNALVVTTYPEEMAKVEALIRTLDRPQKAYRLTYTLTELDGGKTIGTDHLSMVVVEGQHATVKEGNKVPVATGSYNNGTAQSDSALGVQTQFTYLDVGMNIDSALTQHEGGAILKAKVEQSSLGAPSTIAGIQEPVVRQTIFDGIAVLTLDKPLMLGSIDVPNSTHHYDIAVVLQTIK